MSYTVKLPSGANFTVCPPNSAQGAIADGDERRPKECTWRLSQLLGQDNISPWERWRLYQTQKKQKSPQTASAEAKPIRSLEIEGPA